MQIDLGRGDVLVAQVALHVGQWDIEVKLPSGACVPAPVARGIRDVDLGEVNDHVPLQGALSEFE